MFPAIPLSELQGQRDPNKEFDRYVAEPAFRQIYVESLNDMLLLLLTQRVGGDRKKAWELYCDFATRQDQTAIGAMADIIVKSQ